MPEPFPTFKTVEDHVRAAVAAEPEDRAAHLRAAEALAVDCFHMRAFLRAMLDGEVGDGPMRRRIADQVLAMAIAERDISGIRDAADFAREQNGDDSAAFTILNDAIDLFATPVDEYGLAEFGLGGPRPAHGYVFVLLAQDLSKLTDGQPGVVRALTAGRDANLDSDDPDDLEDIANGWIEYIDPEAGAALLAQAQARRAAAQPEPKPDRPDFPEPHPPGQPFPTARPTFGPEPSASALLDLIRANISTASVETIARADYGMDLRAHLEALTAIVETGLVSTPTAWVPGEVLALYRWQTGGETDHLARALCCAVLTLDASLLYPTAFMDTTAPYLVESCLVLGGRYVGTALQLLAWRYCATAEADWDGPADRQASVLAALLLAVLSGTALPDWAAEEFDLSVLNTRLSDEAAMGQAAVRVWHHLLALAVQRIDADHPVHRFITAALTAIHRE